MAFSEDQKLQVKKKAMFRCCRCQNIGIDIHHILPQKDSGPDTLDNAAPLCQNCHDQFGDNPIKRKEIKQMRDHWYEVVEQMYTPKTSLEFPLKEINDKLESLQKNQQTDLSDLKKMLKEISFKTIDNITPGTAVVTASGIMNVSTASIYTKPLNGGIAINPMNQCQKCGKWYTRNMSPFGYVTVDNLCDQCKLETW